MDHFSSTFRSSHYMVLSVNASFIIVIYKQPIPIVYLVNHWRKWDNSRCNHTRSALIDLKENTQKVVILKDSIFCSTPFSLTYWFFVLESKSDTLSITFSICSKAHHWVCALITQSCQSYTSVYSSNIYSK